MTQLCSIASWGRMCCELLSNLYLCIGWHSWPRKRHRAHQGCELLSNLYLCIGWHSQGGRAAWQKPVVNCFQICIFVSDDTAIYAEESIEVVLWIAFKFVSLYRMTQLTVKRKAFLFSCELLSNLYLCIGWHSSSTRSMAMITVVNCFQICIFVSDDTAKEDLHRRQTLLWIAFKFVSLYRMTQHKLTELTNYYSCELLSNLYLCIGWHSAKITRDCRWSVVNCFQICIFVSDDTAQPSSIVVKSPLWIAFKFVSLYRMTQLLAGGDYLMVVVNCFQICIFVSDDTARLAVNVDLNVLWIAFKFVSLYRMTQPQRARSQRARCCELLSNLYLCIGWHSL